MNSVTRAVVHTHKKIDCTVQTMGENETQQKKTLILSINMNKYGHKNYYTVYTVFICTMECWCRSIITLVVHHSRFLRFIAVLVFGRSRRHSHRGSQSSHNRHHLISSGFPNCMNDQTALVELKRLIRVNSDRS